MAESVTSVGFTPKQRMLNAYRGIFSDRYPVAPEFWYFYPAKVLKVDMVEFEREIPLWKALQYTFKKYCTEGWGAVFPEAINEDLTKKVSFEGIGDGRYRETSSVNYRGNVFTASRLYDIAEPSWVEKYPVDSPELLDTYIDMALSFKNIYEFGKMDQAFSQVGEDYLLEVWLGTPFFDFIAEIVGFEEAVAFFKFSDAAVLEAYRERLLDYKKELIKNVCQNTKYESFVIGCSYSCNSLIGPEMWRRWDKAYIKVLADEIHKQGKLLHIHFHGRSIETAGDFAEIGIDCVCPFERGPGGDVDGLDGLLKVRGLLGDRVTMNGNVHTVETLIRGNPKDVRNEVRQIRKAFEGSSRLIIGTGDQVGRETPEENIFAMVEEAKRGD